MLGLNKLYMKKQQLMDTLEECLRRGSFSWEKTDKSEVFSK